MHSEDISSCDRQKKLITFLLVEIEATTNPEVLSSTDISLIFIIPIINYSWFRRWLASSVTFCVQSSLFQGMLLLLLWLLPSAVMTQNLYGPSQLDQYARLINSGNLGGFGFFQNALAQGTVRGLGDLSPLPLLPGLPPLPLTHEEGEWISSSSLRMANHYGLLPTFSGHFQKIGQPIVSAKLWTEMMFQK